MNPETIERVEREIRSGDLGKARDRLHGLIGTYPDDLSLRAKLGQVYWQLQYPAMAGRYWYLEKKKSVDMIAACAAFDRSCGGDPVEILRALKFRGDLDAIRETYAGRLLLALQQQAKDERGVHVEFGKSGKEKYQVAQHEASPTSKWLSIGCLAAALLALGLAIVGLITVLQWIL